jgi:hypothetical protein
MPLKDKAARKQWAATYYLKNQEARKAYARRYSAEHKAEVAAAHRAYYADNADYRAKSLARRAAHRKLHCGPGSTCRSHKSMLTRCTNPSKHNFNRYGGRLTPCYDPRWKDFDAFLVDVGERPSPVHTLHRLNSNFGYHKSNVCWSLDHSERA